MNTSAPDCGGGKSDIRAGSEATAAGIVAEEVDEEDGDDDDDDADEDDDADDEGVRLSKGVTLFRSINTR